MKAPRILISGIPGNRRNYELALRCVGGKPLSCYCPSLHIPADGLLLAGGGDVDPAFLGLPDLGSRERDPARDVAEFALVRAYLAQKKPIFGICRGHQVLNLALGGQLTQDIGPTLERFHSPLPQEGEADLLHGLRSEEGSLLHRLYGPFCLVNSWHHQAISVPGEGMRVTARAESGLIEASEHESLPCFSVQFHPERLKNSSPLSYLAEGAALFAHFVRLCRAV